MNSPKFEKFATYESERLNLRGITIGDADNLVRWRSHEDVYRYALDPRPITHTEHATWFSKYMKNEQSYRAIITEKITGKDIGMIGGECEGEVFVISTNIGEPEFRGMGYASEATSILISLLKKKNVSKIRANIHKDNAATISYLCKSGFIEKDLCNSHDNSNYKVMEYTFL